MDFIKNDPPEIVELYPDRFLKFDSIFSNLGNARLIIEQLRWDDVVVYHDLNITLEKVGPWFVRWFDPDDERLDTSAEFSDAIHSLLIDKGRLSADFGTAPTDAFWELLSLLEAEGARTIRVTSSRDEAKNS